MAKDLIESYKLTTVRDRIGIYGQRLILRLVEFATAEGATEGLDFKSGKDIRKVEVGVWGDRVVTMPITDIMGDTENYSAVKKAVVALQKETIQYNEEDGTWVSFQFIGTVKIGRGMISVKVEKVLWETLMDFRSGFRRFELDAALKLKSTYSLRLYKLVSEQRDINYIDFQLVDLKKMLGVGDKYPRPSDFFKFVIEPAKRELDSIAPWTFTYKHLTSRKVATGRAAIIGIRFYPVYQPEFRDPELAKKQMILHHSEITIPNLTQGQRNILLHKFGFSQKGINANFDLFNIAIKHLDFNGLLDDLAGRVARLRPKNPTGYVINAIKMELDAKGVEY